LQESFEKARQRFSSGSASQFYRFARHLVRAEVFPNQLARAVLPAFGHLRTCAAASAPVELIVSLWKGASAEVSAVQFGDYCVSADARVVGHRSADWLAMYDRAQRHLIAFVPSAVRLSFLARARPLKELLLLWYADDGYQPIHASMIATSAGDGVLISGATGSGKSTTALACVRAGFRFIADDCVALGKVGKDLVGFSIYSSCLVRSELFDDRRIPAAEPSDDVKGRVLLYASEAFPAQTCSEAPVRALLIPNIVDTAGTAVRPLPKREALRALFPSALMVDPAGASRVDAFVALADLLESTPCYRLDLGRDLARAPRAILDALRA
jgi:HPr serine kinase-like protein